MGRRIIAVATFVTLLLVAAQLVARPLDPAGEDWEGLSQFVAMARAEVGAARVSAPRRLDLSRLTPHDALIIVHPTGATEPGELSVFLKSGGRLVLMDDYGAGDELLAHFGIRRVPLPARPAEMLRENPALAIAVPAAAHPVARDVGRLVTNHATGVDHKALSPVFVVRGEGEPDVLLSIAGNVERGRLLVIGDSSIAMNSMLRYPGNRALAAALLRYLTEDDAAGPRGDGKVYMLVDDFELTGSYGTGSGLASIFGDAWRTFDEVLETLHHEGMPPLAAYLFALAIGLALVAWTSVRAGRPHREVTPRFIRATPIVAQGGVAGRAAVIGSPGTQRVLAMLELKSALEEDLATRLGLDRPPSPEDLAKRARAAGILDAARAEAMARMLKMLAGLEDTLSRQQARHGQARVARAWAAWPAADLERLALLARRFRVLDRVKDADVFAVAGRVHELLDAVAGQRP